MAHPTGRCLSGPMGQDSNAFLNRWRVAPCSSRRRSSSPSAKERVPPTGGAFATLGPPPLAAAR
jgi:hypothetical protein